MTEDEAMVKMMFGEHARKVACWVKTFRSGEGVAFCGAARTTELMFGGSGVTMMIGEVIVRPHVAISSKHGIGMGLAGLARECDAEAWAAGTYLVNPMGLTLRENGQLVKL